MLKRLLVAANLCFLMTFGVSSCQDDISEQDHYKTPSWLKGSAYEVLQKEGNHSIFLKGIDLSGYKPVVDGQSLVTVVAPNDNAFRAFLQEKGYSSIEDLNKQDPAYLKRLMTYHLMYYAYDWSKMVNFRPNEGDGATDEQKQVNAGTWYKHRTYSQKGIEDVRVKLSAESTSDTLIKLYHYESYIPVFSSALFQTKGIDPKYNYEYFYPNTSWSSYTGIDGSFNIANAEVSDENNVITDNGYLYNVNQVVEPKGTIYEQLSKNDKYSEYLKFYDNYSLYTLASGNDGQGSVIKSLGYDVYVHKHDGLQNIAVEWPVENSSAGSFSTLERNGYNVFAPSNAAIDKFFSNYWKQNCGYNSMSELDPLILQYFIRQTFSEENFICFPEEIKKGKVLTAYGTPINIDPDKVEDRVICENGVLYGMDNMEAPAIFSCVIGPAFSDTTYVDYLYTLDKSGQILPLSSTETNYVALIPSNKQFENSDPKIRIATTLDGREIQVYNAQEGDFSEMSNGMAKSIVNLHTAQNVKSLPMTGSAVVASNIPYNFWYIKDGKIATSAALNQMIEPSYTGDPFVAFHPVQYEGHDWNNGAAYTYDSNEIFTEMSTDSLCRRLAVCNDKNYPYYMFARLLKAAGLSTTTTLDLSVVPMGSHFVVFIPSNEAIAASLSTIPGCGALSIDAATGEMKGTLTSANKLLLKKWLRQYFITDAMNPLPTYPYVGSECNGKFFDMEANPAVINTKNTVSISNDNGSAEVSSKYYKYPFVFSDGCFHILNDIIK